MLEQMEEVILEQPSVQNGTKRLLLTLDGRITSETASAFSRTLVATDLSTADEVIILINSPGGDLTATEFMLSELSGIRHVTGYAFGNCASAAMFLLQGCKRRFSSSSTVFMVHGVSMSSDPMINVASSHMYDVLKKTQQRLLKGTLAHIKDPETRQKLAGIMNSNSEHYFSPNEAKKYGMITKILPQRTLKWETDTSSSLQGAMTHFAALGSGPDEGDDMNSGVKKKWLH